MRRFFAFLALATMAGCSPAEENGVKISSFGFDEEDSTRFIQAAFDSGCRKLILDRQSGPWYTLPLKMRSDTELIIEPGVELVAKRGEYKGLRDYLLELHGITNVTIRGGKGATLRMWKKDYQGPDYKHGEWRYALRIFRSRNVLVEGLTIVESGGDGIGVTGENIVIRNCVMDRNHRQGVSVFSVDDLLIENCVFSNTSGTPPEAGIDFEPDRSGESLKNVTLRNCLSINNVGRGFEFYLGRLNAASAPISITLENCRSVGNKESAWINGGSHPDVVKGHVNFRSCRFESGSKGGITVYGASARAFDVSFTDCVLSNAMPENVMKPDVLVGSELLQGPCDGIRFDNLTIFQPVDREWFLPAAPAYGAMPRRCGGNVTVVKPDGRRERFALDSAWVERNLSPVNGGRPLPPRAKLPMPENVRVVDKCPGKCEKLSPVTLLYGAHYVFFAEKPGRCEFMGRKVPVVKGRKLDLRDMTVRAVNGAAAGKTWKIPAVKDSSERFAFDAPAAGFYRLDVPSKGFRFILESSNVPVSIDVLDSPHIVAGFSKRPFSLWFAPAGFSPFSFFAGGSSFYRFKASLYAPDGKLVKSADEVAGEFLYNSAAPAPVGLYRVDIAPAANPNYDWITLDAFGMPGCIFLSPDKYWISRK